MQNGQQLLAQLQPVPIVATGDHLLPEYPLPVIGVAAFETTDPVGPEDKVLLEQPAQAFGQLPVL